MTFFVIALVVLSATAAATWTQIDLDKDGLSTKEEWENGTRVALADSDLDGLADGWEVQEALNPLNPDSDADALSDSAELQARLNPLDADMDDDTLLDGHELALGTNMLRRDTDDDGIDDAQEIGTEFDPLDPDSFGISLPDSIVKLYRDAGQAASGDSDKDGIPDAWETSTGLLEWHGFNPQPNRTDLFIEFVVVKGPEASRYTALDFGPVYETIKRVFLAEAGIALQYQQTVVAMSSAQQPGLIPSVYSAYYEDVLNQSRFASNPYVTTVVLNPQHDQSEILHAGIAPIRGMLAAVDYGIHTWMNYRGTYSFYDAFCECMQGIPIEFPLTPAFESIVRGNRQDLIQEMGFTRGYIAQNGDVRLEYEEPDAEFTIAWRPYWFESPPRIEWEDGSVTTMYLDAYDIEHDVLAQTVMHELGHTLGLCHLEDATCGTELSNADEYNRESSTMFTDTDAGTVHFLRSEWTQVKKYVQCPPAEPLRLLTEKATGFDIIEAKYGYTLKSLDEIKSRECGVFKEIPARTNVAAYESEAGAPLSTPHYAENSAQATYVYAISTLLASLALSGGVGLGTRQLQRRR